MPDITAVRTADAKLIKYVDHEEWTELFDLKADPYETKKLFRDPAHAALRDRLEAEHAKLLKQVGYRVPDYTDRPDWWGKAGGPDWKPDATPGLRLHFDFAKLDGDRVVDLSGRNNHGFAHNAVLAEGRDARKALRLSGGGYVEIPNSPSLDPSQSAWTVEVVAKPKRPDGVLVARGGKSQGYALWIKAGRPAFNVVVGNKARTVEAKEPLADWATLSGMITADRGMELRVNGQSVARGHLADFIESDPHARCKSARTRAVR